MKIRTSLPIKRCQWGFGQSPGGTEMACLDAQQLQIQKLQLMSASNQAALLLLVVTFQLENKMKIFERA